MPVSQAWRPARVGGLTPEQLEMLYEPILLYDALHKASAFATYPRESDNQLAGTYQAEMSDLKAFRFYVNKLAQACDNERGGDTVSAIAILRGSAGPKYVIGSNFRDPGDLQRTEDFMQRLLDLIGKNPDDLQLKALRSRVLWFILGFNIPRLEEYLQNLSQAVQECRGSCERKEEDESRCFRMLIFDYSFAKPRKILSRLRALCAWQKNAISYWMPQRPMKRIDVSNLPL